MASVNFIKVSTDFENNPEEFWQEIHDRADAGEEIAKLLQDSDKVIVTEEKAQQIKEYCAQIEGWEDPDAPEYAPCPLLFEDVDDFRQAGYDDFNKDPEDQRGITESYNPFCDSEYYHDLEGAAQEIAEDQYLDGWHEAERQFKEYYAKIESELREQMSPADNEPLRGESTTYYKHRSTKQEYAVKIESYSPSISLDFFSIWATVESDLIELRDNGQASEQAIADLAALQSIESNWRQSELPQN